MFKESNLDVSANSSILCSFAYVHMGCCHPKHVPVLPVQCPPNYDQAAFQKICRLFALLDKDSNFGVDIDEVSTVADLYCQNRSRIITEKLTALDRDFHAFEQSNTLSMNNELASCKALYNERAENFRLNIESRKRALTKSRLGSTLPPRMTSVKCLWKLSLVQERRRLILVIL